MFITQPHHIIAIGASAGGMEEINSFFDHTPLDGVSYVIVQHLSPDFKSRMAELLSKHSKLKVREAQDKMTVQSNEVYLIPNDKFMTISDGILYLTDKENVKGPHLTINKFFNSLALNSGKRAIAIILSGLGSDGTEGVYAIKNAGGMVIARDPKTSDFNSMPSNAIATGMVDFILEPSLMPGIIEDYVKHEQGLLIEDRNEEKNLLTIINIIKEQSPLDFTDYKQATILRRIKRRSSFNNFIKLENYIDFLKVTPEEVTALAKDFLISVTSFFRDKEAFDFIQQSVLPAIFNKIEVGDEIKFWIAGCATGEEAYSLAILIAEQMTGKYADTLVKIFATDIDTVALVNAGKGVYNNNIEKTVPAEWIEKYFTKLEDTYEIKPQIRKMVIFAQHDLVKNPPYSNMNFISCRNLLIYMTPVLQKKIFLMLLFGLKMDGYLFIGSSENPTPITEHLDVVNKKWKIYKNLEKKRVVRFDGFALPQMIDIKHKNATTTREDNYLKIEIPLGETVYETLLKEMDSLAICIDEENHVVKTYGDTTKYLLQKNFNLNLADLLPKQLAIAFNTISISARRNKRKETVNGILINQDGKVIKVNLSVSPLEVKNMENLQMVTFTEDKEISAAEKESNVFDEKIYSDKYTVMIEDELNELKEKLYSSYQQLDASNDNMQSYNEELLSANEEMQSTNEEMQSVNEELHTINSEYQLKNKELLELNDDLNNYFRSNINGQLFVNNDLLLMKFSPGAVNQINLMPNDVGRPLSHISTNIKFETIIQDIRLVLEKGTIITKEIETDKGKWYQIMTMPYLQQPDNKISGAIITFNDISELKKMQEELDKKNRSLLKINADLDNFVLTASQDLLIPLSNMELSIGLINDISVVDPELNKSLKIINSSVKKVRSLVKNITLVAKIENESDAPEVIAVSELIKEIEDKLFNKIKAEGAVINKNIEGKYVYFSKKNLGSIIYSLLNNAIKFKDEVPPVISIDFVQEEHERILIIQDNGIGIEKHTLATIFDSNGKLKHQHEGLGMRLYFAKKIIEAAGGTIDVTSKPRIGTKFIIKFKNQELPDS